MFFAQITDTLFDVTIPDSGKHMSAAVVVTKIIPTKIFSSVGKKPEATAIATDQAATRRVMRVILAIILQFFNS